MITIEAKYVSESKNAWLLDCEGDEEWFPKSQVNFDQVNEELSIPDWLYEEKFPEEFPDF